MSIHPAVAKAIAEFDAVIIGPGSFYTSLMPIFLVRGVAEALAQMKGPVILIANLLTEGRGMVGFTAADAVARIEEAIQRQGRRRDHQHEMAVAAGARPLRARAQGAARARAAAGALRAGGRGVLDRRDRAARSAAARLRGVERAVASGLLWD